MLSEFFHPYLNLLEGAVWTLEQSLDGFGISPTAVMNSVTPGHMPPLASLPSNATAVTFLDAPDDAALLYFGGAIVIAVIISALTLVTGYVLARRTGAAVATFLMAAPGMLSMASVWPTISIRPDTYVAGGHGVMGTGWGMAVLVGLGTLIGWCLAVIAVDLFRLKDKFWHFYDHLWCVAGLLAAIFFVADTQVNFHTQELQESSRTSQQASAYLGKQAAMYDQWCRANGRTDTASCRWASQVQQRLLDYATEHTQMFQEFGPRTSADVYAWAWKRATAEEIEAIRTEIADYNQKLCPVTHIAPNVGQNPLPSVSCLHAPSSFEHAFPDPFRGRSHTEALRGPVALNIEGIVPTLVQLRTEQLNLQAKVEADQHSRYARWFYYLFFSVVVGGKVAGSTAKIAKLAEREPDQTRRSLHLVKRVAQIAWLEMRRLLQTARSLLQALAVTSIRLLGRWRRSRPKEVSEHD